MSPSTIPRDEKSRGSSPTRSPSSSFFALSSHCAARHTAGVRASSPTSVAAAATTFASLFLNRLAAPARTPSTRATSSLDSSSSAVAAAVANSLADAATASQISARVPPPPSRSIARTSVSTASTDQSVSAAAVSASGGDVFVARVNAAAAAAATRGGCGGAASAKSCGTTSGCARTTSAPRGRDAIASSAAAAATAVSTTNAEASAEGSRRSVSPEGFPDPDPAAAVVARSSASTASRATDSDASSSRRSARSVARGRARAHATSARAAAPTLATTPGPGRPAPASVAPAATRNPTSSAIRDAHAGWRLASAANPSIAWFAASRRADSASGVFSSRVDTRRPAAETECHSRAPPTLPRPLPRERGGTPAPANDHDAARTCVGRVEKVSTGTRGGTPRSSPPRRSPPRSFSPPRSSPPPRRFSPPTSSSPSSAGGRGIGRDNASPPLGPRLEGSTPVGVVGSGRGDGGRLAERDPGTSSHASASGGGRLRSGGGRLPRRACPGRGTKSPRHGPTRQRSCSPSTSGSVARRAAVVKPRIRPGCVANAADVKNVPVDEVAGKSSERAGSSESSAATFATTRHARALASGSRDAARAASASTIPAPGSTSRLRATSDFSLAAFSAARKSVSTARLDAACASGSSPHADAIAADAAGESSDVTMDAISSSVNAAKAEERISPIARRASAAGSPRVRRAGARTSAAETERAGKSAGPPELRRLRRLHPGDATVASNESRDHPRACRGS